MLPNTKETCDAIGKMDNHLRNDLFVKDGEIQRKKLWENTFIKHQIDRRKDGYTFSINDHIRAMLYSMISSGISWKRIESGIEESTGKILSLDKLFCEY